MAFVEGVAVNVFTGLAGQIGKIFFRKYALPLRMRRRLSGVAAKTYNKIILEALQSAFGGQGTLTKSSNAALVDITNSRLLEYLIAIFGSSLDNNSAITFIEYIHRSYNITDFEESNRFAHDLAKCLTLLQENILKTSHTEIDKDSLAHLKSTMEERARQADAVLYNIVQKIRDKEGNWLAHIEIDTELVAKRIEDDADPLTNYVKSLKKSLDLVDVHGASGDVVQIPLEKIYVDTSVNLIERNRNFNLYQDLRKHISRHQISENWRGTLEYIHSTVLLGDPGGGKSTLSKKLCLEICNKYITGQPKLPIYIQLRTFIASASDEKVTSLEKYIINFVKSMIPDSNVQDFASTIIYKMRIGTIFFVADGLDEVLTSSNRSRVVRELNIFRKEYPLCQILVTSRYVGYETQPMEGFTHLGVDFLRDPAIEQIFRNVSSAVLKRTDVEIDGRLPIFLTDARRKAAELIRSPLLLTLIVIIYDKKSEIPDNRASLYSFCANLLFDQWDKYRDINPELPERYRLFDLFMHLSALLYENEEYGGRIGKEDLEKEARDFFRSDYIDNREGKSAQAAMHMVQHLTGRAWILHEVGENVFEFTHRTFMEYFYARYLDTLFEDTSQLIDNCIPHVIEGRRTLPTHLALQIRTNNKRLASSKVAKSLANALKKDVNSKELLDFCLDTLGYILPSAKELEELVSPLAKSAIFSKSPSAALKILCTQNPFRNSILQICEPYLEQISTVNQVKRIAPAFHQMHKEQTNILTIAEGEKINITNRLLERLYNKQSTSPFMCKLAFDLDAKVNWESAEKYGLRLWTNSQTEYIEFFRLCQDSQHMLKEASDFLLDENCNDGKYLRMAQSILPKIVNDETRHTFHHFFFRHFPSEEFRRVPDLNSDASTWRAAPEALEIFAFSLVLYAETHLEIMSKSTLRKIQDIMQKLIDALNDTKSEGGTWYQLWLKGECTMLVNSTERLTKI